MRTIGRLVALALAAGVAAACTGAPAPSAAPVDTTTPYPSLAAATSEPATAEPATAAPTATADPCAPDQLATKTAGTLTFGTDNPAFPPYFEKGDVPIAPPWEDLGYTGDPRSGKGFESAVAYAVADKLGFGKDKVSWVYVPFDSSYAPGDKTFDIDINQISYTADRAKAVDMTDGYYTVNQALVANADTPITKVTTVSGLKDSKLGAQQGTTSYTFITDTIQPTNEASVYPDNSAAIAGLNAKQIDGIVVDLPTAFYITAAQMKNGVIVGQFPAPAGADAEHFSMVLQQGSPLTACVNTAIGGLKADGTLDAITKEWLSDKASAPVLQP